MHTEGRQMSLIMDETSTLCDYKLDIVGINSPFEKSFVVWRHIGDIEKVIRIFI